MEFLEGISSCDYCVEHESRPAGSGFGDESVEVIDGLSESALVLHTVVEEEERNHVLQVVSDGPKSKCFEEGLDCSYSPQIRLIEELTAHRSRYIE